MSPRYVVHKPRGKTDVVVETLNGMTAPQPASARPVTIEGGINTTLHAHSRAVVTRLSESGERPMYVGYLADETGMSIPTIVDVLQRLKADGLVRCVSRRNEEWALTPAGKAAAWLLNDDEQEVTR